MPNASPECLRRPSRLEALQATGLLDAPPQEALDRLTRLTARLLGVPIAVVSLVDTDRQHFASHVGVGEPWATQQGTPLSYSFCQHVVATRAPLVIEDARAHALVSDSLAIPDLGVIAYAGMPITSADGEVLGSFCAIDTSPRVWTPDEIAVIEDLAHAATAEIQLRAATKLLISRESYLSTLLDHIGDLVCATDEAGMIAYANRAMLMGTGYSLDDLAGKRPVDLIAPEGLATFAAAGMRVRGGEVIRDFETVVIAKNGDRLLTRGSAFPIYDQSGAIVGARVIFRDLTKERAAQKLKDELIALVSHELRGPVGAIRSSLKILARDMTELEGRPRQMFDMALRNSERLLTLLNDLLDLERIEAGQVRLELGRVPAMPALEQARDALRAVADNAEVQIEVAGVDVAVSADGGRLEQVLVNLIGNAIKFSPAGSTIRLRVEPRGTEALFCVADEGRGIPAEKLAQVFERFEQVSQTDATEKGGAGLGLTICKAIVEQHGGKIWVESEPGAGCRFYFTLPGA